MRFEAKSHNFGSMAMKLKKIELKNLKSSPTHLQNWIAMTQT